MDTNPVQRPTFSERAPYEAGFAAVFDREIAPKLQDMEVLRRSLVSEMWRRVRKAAFTIVTVIAVSYFFLSGLVLGFLGWVLRLQLSEDNKLPIGIIMLFILLIGVGYVIYVWIYAPKKEFKNTVRDFIMDIVCQFMGDLQYSRKPGGDFHIKRFSRLGIVGASKIKRFEDLFVGRHRDTAFKLVEAVIETGGKNSSTVFDGVFLEIDVPQDFSCRVLIGRDKGKVINSVKGFFKGLKKIPDQRVVFDHPAFDVRYAVYADDVEGALNLMTPGFCDALVDLANSYGENALSGAFIDGQFLLAIPIKGNLFEFGAFMRPVYNCEDDLHELLHQITIAHRIIDRLHSI
jgi:hypothetical protein